MAWIRRLLGRRPSGGAVAGVCIDGSRMVLATGAGRSWVADAARRGADVAQSAAALAALVERHGARGQSAVLTLPFSGYQLLQIERPPVEAHELADASRWKIRDAVDFDVEQALVEVFPAPDAGGRRSDEQPMVNVVVARPEPLRELSAVVSQAGLRLVSMDIAELSVRSLAQRWSAADEMVATVLLTANQGTIQISRDGVLMFARRLDYGLDALGPFDPQATGIHSRLPLELQRTLDYFDSHFAHGPVTRLLCCPAQAHVVSYMRDIGEMAGLPVDVIAAAAPDSGASDGASDALHSGEAWLAIGGVLGYGEQLVSRTAA